MTLLTIKTKHECSFLKNYDFDVFYRFIIVVYIKDKEYNYQCWDSLSLVGMLRREVSLERTEAEKMSRLLP